MSTQFKPILFSTPMVQAILEGRKTQTRRTKGLEKINENPDDWVLTPTIKNICRFFEGENKNPNPINKFWIFENKKSGEIIEIDCNYGVVRDIINNSDILWVREKHIAMIDCETNEFAGYWYYADMPEKFHKEYKRKWKPSIHMPKAACRLFLRIKDVRVERLQDITRDDCKKEGIAYLETVQEMWSKVGGSWYDYERKTFASLPSGKISPSMSFMSLWRSINGAESWNANPWVWVIEFERVEKPTNF